MRIKLHRRSSSARGQSLVEFTIVAPIICMILLGVANVGLAVRAQLELAQVTQQAVQSLVYNPSYGNTSNGALLAYMNNISSYPLSPLQITVITGTTTLNDGTTKVMQDTVSVQYPFNLVVPMGGLLSVGMLHKGAIALGARESSLVSTSAPSPSSYDSGMACVVTSTNDCPDASWTGGSKVRCRGCVEVLWQPPSEATNPGVQLDYCLERQYVNPVTGDYAHDLYYSDAHSGFAAVNNLECVTAQQSTTVIDGSVPEMYFLDDNGVTGGYPGPTYPAYSVVALQRDGLASKGLSIAVDAGGGS
jgi:Flp pilus assembly protein TadG